MKRWAIVAFCVLVSLAAWGQGGERHNPETVFVVLLNRPANAPTYSKEKLEEIQDGHMANIRRLAAERKMIMAGPFMDDTPLKGIFVFRAKDAAEVKALLTTDPAVKAGRLEGDVHPWGVFLGEIHDVTKLPQSADMEPFVVMIYRAGEKLKTMPYAQQDPIWKEHLKYHKGLYASKQIEIGGPFTDDTSFTGFTIAHGKKEDGEKLAADDPAVKAGLVRVECHEWITARGVLYH